MIMSMTGFGKKEIHNNDISITVELKSISVAASFANETFASKIFAVQTQV